MTSPFLDALRDSKPSRRTREIVGVAYSSEFRRIEALPWRVWEAPQELVALLTEELGLGGMSLWPVQAAALKDIVLQRGAFLPIGVGQGKALISLLAPVVLEAQRPVLFVPAQLREQTLNYVLPAMRKHWRLHPKLRVIGYSELSLAKNADLLDELKPDLIILDECHRTKNPKAGRTRRLTRYFKAHPETLCVAMSGTVSNRSLRDFAHILKWCLKERSPLPDKWHELSDWADAVDEKVPEDRRLAPGALMRFCREGENVRQGFRRRFTSTPGIVATNEDQLGVSLRIEAVKGVKVPRKVYQLIEDLSSKWITPNGDELSEAVEVWRHIRELALGFFYRWQPPPPKEWLIARTEWKRYVRHVLQTNRRALDTELQVWNECSKNPCEEWEAWVAVRDTYKPETVPEWIDDFALKTCSAWMKDGGICWVEHRAFGQRLAEVSGYKYFGAGDDSILSCSDDAIIASIQAHAEGKNLQRFSRNLVAAPMASGKTWEQLLGRTHRKGQEADEVTCDVFLYVDGLRDSFAQARADAQYLEDTFGNRQKLNFADVVL